MARGSDRMTVVPTFAPVDNDLPHAPGPALG